MANYTDVVVYSSGRLVHPASGDTLTTDLNVSVSGKLTALGDAAVDGDLVVAGSLTVQGAVTSIETTNLTVTDQLIMLNDGDTAGADSGIIIERGATGDNAAFIWDESADKFTLGTTTADATESGDIGITVGTLVANVEGDVTFGDLVGSAGGATVTQILDEDDMSSNTVTALATQQSIKAYVDNAVSSGTAGSVAADNIAAGDAAVEITTTLGDILVDAPSGQSVDLQIDGSNVVEVAGGRVDVSQPLVLGSNAGVSLTASQTATIVAGNILSVDSTGQLVLSDADSGTEQVKEIIGVAIEASAAVEQSILIHTVHGSRVNVVTDGAGTTAGKPVYLSDTAGKVTETAPTSGYVYRAGIALEATTTETDVDILWMPQFIADLG